MKQVLIQTGNVLVENVPAPAVEPGHVLVHVINSCISAGTEMSGIRASAVPLWKRALKQPEKIKKVIDVAMQEGLSKATSLVEKTKAWQPTGYSASGIVLAVGHGVENFKVGDRVGCAGAQCAYHAEIINVPENLTVKIPDGVSFGDASTVTLGAIAMQGVRRLNPTLGETFVVVGLGILGQMTVQMLKANGCRVIVIDLDRSRVDLAMELGADLVVDPMSESDVDTVFRMTEGFGADGVVITAATSSDAVIASSFKMCRKKGRVVLVGDVGLNINRNDIYMKELDFFVSTSYGPGRYDTRYEEQGLDYPISYVRWTEGRNLAEYLRMISAGTMKLGKLIQAEYSIDEAAVAYEKIKDVNAKPLIVLLKYPDFSPDITQKVRVSHNVSQPVTGNTIKVGFIGAGGFAQYAHLPNMKSLKDYNISAIVTRSGHKGVAVAKQYQAEYATTEMNDVLNDKNIDMVVIATRHNTHMKMAIDSLRKGKHVLLEKPMCINADELNQLKAYFEENKQTPILMTGFNRRFSPIAKKIKESLKSRNSPMIINYRMNSGFIPLDNWVHGPEGGGRNIGEACHIYDLFTYLTDSEVVDTKVQSIGSHSGSYSLKDNFVAVFTFKDGSVASLTYTAMGDSSYPKEHMEIYVSGKVLVMEDYKTLRGFGGASVKIEGTQDKGQLQELVEFAQAAKGGSWPIPLWQQVQATQMSLDVENLLTK